ncbi:MAG: cellulose synthase subunit BcsC-related outer membrane protein [Candidatus Korobacteraceae bacterium]
MNRRQRLLALMLMLVVVAAVSGFAASSATDLLLAKARSLEGRGLMDLAAQSWQQVLMSDPNQPEALAGLARWAKQTGRAEEASQYLARLRKVSPQDPAIANVESMKVTGPKQRARLEEAVRLAQAHQYEASLAIYREVLGDEPPPGAWAIAYYETEAATPDGYDHAVAGMKKMAERFPNDQQYRLSYGRLLTYRTDTRTEGIRVLTAIPANSMAGDAARKAWRQALVWDGTSASNQSFLREYLARYPDSELQSYLSKSVSDTAAAAPSAPSQGPEEKRGYEALNAGNLSVAEANFQEALKRNAKSASALSGMGFVRLKQEDFSGAIEYFEKAKVTSPTEAAKVASFLALAHFWNVMRAGDTALTANQPEVAKGFFQQALKLRPDNLEALQGYAGSLIASGDPGSAVSIYKRMTEVATGNALAWRGLVTAQFESGDLNGANDTLARMPLAVKSALSKDIDYLALLVSIYGAQGRDSEVQGVVQEALLLANLRDAAAAAKIEVQFAGLLMQNGQTLRASALYQRVADLNPDNVAAWQGLVSSLLQMHDYPRTVSAVKRMPKPTYDAAIRIPDFLLSIAAIYENQGQYDAAEGFVQRAVDLESKGGRTPSVATEIALGNIWLKQNRDEEANQLFRALLKRNPDNPDAWKGYVAALHQQRNDTVAYDESQQIPEPVIAQLKKDVGYLSLMASVNSALKQYDEAQRLLRQAIFHYELRRLPIPPELELQMAWLLLDMGNNERELYSLLSQATTRRDLTNSQRKSFLDIWTDWSLRQAEIARQAGDANREIEILQAANRALPGNNRVRGTLAGALLTQGDARDSYALYKAWGLKGGEVQDYTGAIGAAMTVHESIQANAWMTEALRRWPSNSQVLMLAAQSEESKGNYDKAKAYWEAALKHLPVDEAGSTNLAGFGVTINPVPGGHQMQTLAEVLMPGDTLPPPSTGSTSGRTVDPAQRLSLPPLPPTGGQPSQSGAVQKKGRTTKQSVPTGQPISSPYSGKGAMLKTVAQAQYSGGTIQPTQTNQRDITAATQSGGEDDSGRALNFPAPQTRSDSYTNDFPSANFVQPVAPVAATPQDQLSMRDEIQGQIAAIEGRNSPYAGGSGYVSNRSGSPGFERLADEEVPLEASTVVFDSLRITAIARPVFLSAGTPDGTSLYRFGTSLVGTTFGAQSATGLGGEVQLSTQDFGLRFGISPTGFLVNNFLGGVRWRIAGGPVTIWVTRDNVKDTLLSYAGTKDPASGSTWGGVVSNSGVVQGNWGGADRGFYGSFEYQYLTGTNVATNTRIDGNVGAYWKIYSRSYGSLTVGANVFGMGYAKNLRYFTYGQGGYFSPQEYLLLNAPIRWVGRYKRNFEYSITGSLGAQQFREDASPFFPTDPALQGKAGPYYPGQSVSGANYNIEFRGDYHLPGNWYLSAFMDLNNARDYNQQVIGFTLRYLFRDSATAPEAIVPTIPDWKGLQPFTLP